MKRLVGRLHHFTFYTWAPMIISSLIFGAWSAGAGFASETKTPQKETHIECHGTVYAASRYTLSLNPGENILQIHVRKGQRVKAGDLLVTLNNNQLIVGLADLMLKQKALLDVNGEFRLMNLELKQKKERQRELIHRIATGRQLMKQMPALSVERELEPLLDRQKDQQEQMELLRVRIDLMRKQNSDNSEIISLLDDRIIMMRDKIKALNVRAPFSGRVDNVCRYPRRLAAGKIALDLSDDNNLLVNARVLQHQLAHIQIGDQAKVYLDFGSHAPLTATVEQVLPGDMTPSGDVYPSFGVILKIDQQQSWGRPGMKVRIRLGETKHQ